MASPKKATGLRLKTGARIPLLRGNQETPEMEAARAGAPESAQIAADGPTAGKNRPLEAPSSPDALKRADGAEWSREPVPTHDGCGGTVKFGHAGMSIRATCGGCGVEWARRSSLDPWRRVNDPGRKGK